MIRTHHSMFFAIAASGFLVLGCQDGAIPSEQVLTSDQAADNSAIPQWALPSEPAVRIGGADEREGYVLHQVESATRMSTGQIVVANGSTDQLLIYDGEGQHQKTIGGQGDAPGEFRLLRSVAALPGDSLLVFAMGSGLTWFDPSGVYVRSVRFRALSSPSFPCRLAESRWHYVGDGNLVAVAADRHGVPGCPDLPPPGTEYRQSGAVLHIQPASNTYNTLGVFAAQERISLPPNNFGNAGAHDMYFGRDLVVATAFDRVFVGDSGDSIIVALSLDGDTLAVLPTPFEATPLTPEARETRAGAGGEVYPRFSRLLVDSEGMLWVMAYPRLSKPIMSSMIGLPRYVGITGEPDGTTWRVLDPSGRILAEVQTPPRFFPVEIGEDYVLGISVGEFNLESVELYALDRQL